MFVRVEQSPGEWDGDGVGGDGVGSGRRALLLPIRAALLLTCIPPRRGGGELESPLKNLPSLLAHSLGPQVLGKWP